MVVSGADRSVFTRNFKQVLAKEYAAVRGRRSANDIQIQMVDDKNAPPELFGVALSGGGIRSASFCLGALQALDQYDLVKRIDYLSTVSGGGYTGASMIAAMKAWEEKNPIPGAGAKPAIDDAFPFSAGDNADVRDSAQVSHIRDYSRYLAPKGFYDLVVSVAVILRGLLVNLLLLLSLLLPLSTLIVLTNPTAAHLDHSILLDLAEYGFPEAWQSGKWWTRIQYILSDPLILTKSLAVVLVYWLVGWALWRSAAEIRNAANRKFHFEYNGPGATFGRILLVALLVALLLELQPVIIARLADFFGRPDANNSWLAGFTAALGAAAGAVAFFRQTLAGWIQKALNSPTVGARIQAWLAWAGFYALGLVLPLFIYAAFLMITMWGIQFSGECCGIVPPPALDNFVDASTLQIWLLASLVFMIVVGVISSDILNIYHLISVSLLRMRFIYNLIARSKRVLMAFVFVVFVILSAVATRCTDSQWIILSNYALFCILFVIICAGFSQNANALYRLYRDRLRVAFRLDKADGSPLQLHELGERHPYILLNGTLNVRSPQETQPDKAVGQPVLNGMSRSPDPAKRGRNAEFFLFSKHFVGSESTGYVNSETLQDRQKELDLAACVAISGAAVSSSMGRIGVGLLGPTLSLLNVRLGFWLRNPSIFDPDEPIKDDFRDQLPLYLFAEAFGRLRSDSPRIYITDGGHIDNIGLYQLLKRRCKLIVVIDAEADPGMNFGAFCDVQRFARIDEGVRISLDWQPVRAAAVKRSAERRSAVPENSDIHNQHFAIGRIVYENDPQEGVLLYVKASMTGDEPDYVLDYERRYPRFPHESTGDQFFSEEQMEAYRSLGFHAMRVALREPELPASAMKGTSRTDLVAEFKYRLDIAGVSIDKPRPR